MLHFLSHFGLTPGRLASEHPLPGSPERAIRRLALYDSTNRLWMLEQLAPGQEERRQELGVLLDALSRQDAALGAVLPAPLEMPNAPRTYVLQAEDSFWQLSPCVTGMELPRPSYLDDSWRGAAVADFLLALWRAGNELATTAPLAVPPPSPAAQLARYRDELFAAIDHYRPDLTARLARCRAGLANLPEVLAEQPSVLVHGDLHPLNILWGTGTPGDTIRSVIDWEFAGTGPMLYDAANCLGCAGFEHPSALGRDFAAGLMAGLAAGGVPSTGLALLPRMVLASRLGWLSEWLRRDDADLLDMELDYLDLLADAADRD
jgi:Putative homoserine kinase type II (protein kinase fold)